MRYEYLDSSRYGIKLLYNCKTVLFSIEHLSFENIQGILEGTFKPRKISLPFIKSVINNYDSYSYIDDTNFQLLLTIKVSDHDSLFCIADKVLLAKDENEGIRYRDLDYIEKIYFVSKEFTPCAPNTSRDNIIWVKNGNIIGNVNNFFLHWTDFTNSSVLSGHLIVDNYFYGNYIACGDFEINIPTQNGMCSTILSDIELYDEIKNTPIITKQDLLMGFLHKFKCRSYSNSNQFEMI